MGAFPKQVKIVEVGPRDGLQNEKVKMEAASEKMIHTWVLSIPGRLGQVHYGLLINWNIGQLLIQVYYVTPDCKTEYIFNFTLMRKNYKKPRYMWKYLLRKEHKPSFKEEVFCT